MTEAILEVGTSATPATAKQELVDSLLLRAFALAEVLVAERLLNLLEPSLGAAEEKYVNETGPMIREHYARYEAYSVPASCPEGREELKKARELERQAATELDAAGVSKNRQSILEWLVFRKNNTDWPYVFPRFRTDLESWLRTTYLSDKGATIIGLARKLKLDCALIDFLEHTRRCFA